jgi:hypothetical protein
MSSRIRFASLFVAIFALAFLVACGSSSNKATPPPTGGFSNSSLSGTYVFSFAGTDFTTTDLADSESFFAVVGTFTANGSGALTGTVDVNDPELQAALGLNSNVQTGLSATGNYSITADGRGSGTLTATIGTTTYPFGLDFVLSSTNHGLITRFDASGTGSGTIDLQTSGVPQSALVGSYSFALSGWDSITAENSLGTVGTFTLDGSGNATGIEDFNDDGNAGGLTALTLASGSTVLAGSPGTSALSTSAFPGLTFDVWVIDSTHLKLIETDTSGPVLSGDAYVSTGQSFPAGNLALSMSGVDDGVGEEGAAPLALGGIFSTSSNPNNNAGAETVNDGGSPLTTPTSVTTSYSTTNGRTLLTLGNVYNGGWPGSAPSTTGSYSFAAYPFSYGTGGVGVVLLEVDGLGGITSGTAYLQTSTSLASGQGYGLNLSGENSNGEADMIAEFTLTSSSDITGLYDVNNEGSLISDYNLNTSNNASYTLNSNGQGTAQFPSLQTNGSSEIGALSLTFYTVDGTNVSFVETDNDQVATGTFELQNASGSSAKAAALPHFAMVHSSSKALKARQNRQKK